MSSAARAWLTPRLPTLGHIGVSLLTWPLLMGAVYWLMPDVAPLESATDRLLLAVRWAALPGAIVFLMLLGCMRVFDTENAEDPFAGAESRQFQINQRVIQNTIEQMAYFVPPLLALAVTMEPAQTKMIGVLVTAWCIGRLVFWVGYRIDPEHRSLGFGWTAYTAMLTLVWYVASAF